MTNSRTRRHTIFLPTGPNVCLWGIVDDVINCAKNFVNRFRGSGATRPGKMAFPIDFVHRPYDSAAPPCCTVITSVIIKIENFNGWSMGMYHRSSSAKLRNFTYKCPGIFFTAIRYFQSAVIPQIYNQRKTVRVNSLIVVEIVVCWVTIKIQLQFSRLLLTLSWGYRSLSIRQYM